ncbi:hypothetical protein ACFE04_014095 [Oxalis oulophora]
MDYVKNVTLPADSSYLNSLTREHLNTETSQAIAMSVGLAIWSNMLRGFKVQLMEVLDRLVKYSKATSKILICALDADRDVAILKYQIALVQAEVTRLEVIINEHASMVEKYEVENVDMKANMRLLAIGGW